MDPIRLDCLSERLATRRRALRARPAATGLLARTRRTSIQKAILAPAPAFSSAHHLDLGVDLASRPPPSTTPVPCLRMSVFALQSS